MFSSCVKEILPQCVEWRRLLHRRPELAFQEKETTEFLVRELSAIPGLTLSRPTATGVVAELKGAYPGRTIGLRADIDALPITEQTGLPYASEVEGVMHACGHDGHTAMLLAAARLLSEKREQLHGSVRFIFQHAEELPPGGAAEMTAAGVADGLEELYGFHLSSNFPTGTFGVRCGALTSATDRFDITVVGKGGHSAFPETCVDPVVVAAQIILALQTIVSRSIRAVEPAVVSVCMLSAGQAYNVIPGTVQITGSTRTFDADTRENLPVKMERIVKGLCDSAGADYRFAFEKGYASVINDRALTLQARQLIADTFGEQAVLDIDPVMPGEDFSAFLTVCPGYFVELGARNEEKDCANPHHNSKYRMDEDALGYGLEYIYRLVLSRLG